MNESLIDRLISCSVGPSLGRLTDRVRQTLFCFNCGNRKIRQLRSSEQHVLATTEKSDGIEMISLNSRSQYPCRNGERDESHDCVESMRSKHQNSVGSSVRLSVRHSVSQSVESSEAIIRRIQFDNILTHNQTQRIGGARRMSWFPQYVQSQAMKSSKSGSLKYLIVKQAIECSEQLADVSHAQLHRAISMELFLFCLAWFCFVFFAAFAQVLSTSSVVSSTDNTKPHTIELRVVIDIASL